MRRRQATCDETRRGYAQPVKKGGDAPCQLQQTALGKKCGAHHFPPNVNSSEMWSCLRLFPAESGENASTTPHKWSVAWRSHPQPWRAPWLPIYCPRRGFWSRDRRVRANCATLPSRFRPKATHRLRSTPTLSTSAKRLRACLGLMI